MSSGVNEHQPTKRQMSRDNELVGGLRSLRGGFASRTRHLSGRARTAPRSPTTQLCLRIVRVHGDDMTVVVDSNR